MFIRSWFSGCFVNREGMFFLPCCLLFLIAFTAFQLSSFLGRFPLKDRSPSRRERRFRCSLTTRLGYHGFSGLSFNLWFEFSLRRKLSFPFRRMGNVAENAFPGACKTIVSTACLRPVPLLSGVPIP